ncbi:hypothetical protein G6M89_14495 [Natronolimnobius sp. AArcel1]|uniref:hypothetical protein n=1 Tax=Natronolimnobius sp. AArcel1 TaxID=1679093 RepID=UPI0013EB6429|nr:hypothetical protein [Natronolimnobius sp. AArcel1]NGM70204.1 hypothetical protein [Natronolimnobius sp. AArcel1]
MELSPEEYGAYWRASFRIAAGLLVIMIGQTATAPLFGYGNVGATAFGVFLLVALVLAGSFITVLGVSRVVRTAVDAEMRG